MKPPTLATWLMERFGVQESIVGDLVERIAVHRSSTWYWRQVLIAIALSISRYIWTDRLLTLRAVLLGWALLLAFGSIPLSNWIRKVTVEWELDAVQSWLFGRGPWPGGGVGLWLPTLLFGIATGYLVARVHSGKSMAMVFALLSTVALASGLPYLVWAQRSLMHASSRSELGTVFMLYVQAWAFFSGIGIVVGGLLGARSDRGEQRSFA